MFHVLRCNDFSIGSYPKGFSDVSNRNSRPSQARLQSDTDDASGTVTGKKRKEPELVARNASVLKFRRQADPSNRPDKCQHDGTYVCKRPGDIESAG